MILGVMLVSIRVGDDPVPVACIIIATERVSVVEMPKYYMLRSFTRFGFTLYGRGRGKELNKASKLDLKGLRQAAPVWQKSTGR